MKKCKNGQHLLNWNECGYGGGPTADVLCDKCDRSIEVPLVLFIEKVPYLYRLWILHNNKER